MTHSVVSCMWKIPVSGDKEVRQTHLDTASDCSVLADNAIWILQDNITSTKVPSAINQGHEFTVVIIFRWHRCQKILAPFGMLYRTLYPIMHRRQTLYCFFPLCPSAGRIRQEFPVNTATMCREIRSWSWLPTCLYREKYFLAISDEMGNGMFLLLSQAESGNRKCKHCPEACPFGGKRDFWDLLWAFFNQLASGFTTHW